MPEWLTWILIGGGAVLLLLGALWLLSGSDRPHKGNTRVNDAVLRQQASSIRSQSFRL